MLHRIPPRSIDDRSLSIADSPSSSGQTSSHRESSNFSIFSDNLYSENADRSCIDWLLAKFSMLLDFLMAIPSYFTSILSSHPIDDIQDDLDTNCSKNSEQGVSLDIFEDSDRDVKGEQTLSEHDSSLSGSQIAIADVKDRTCAQVLTGLLKNTEKAVVEHSNLDRTINYMHTNLSAQSLKDAQQRLDSLQLNIEHAVAENCGRRRSMEDASVVVEQGVWLIAGVFDGHGGVDVAKLAAKMLPDQFLYHAQAGDIRIALEKTLQSIHENIPESESIEQGSTAVISVVNKQSGLVYTATLGDSEANIYRRDAEGCLRSIPLSCVRNWSSARDLQRLVSYYQPSSESNEPIDGYHLRIKAVFQKQIQRQSDAKSYRIPPIAYRNTNNPLLSNRWVGINVSRALGDSVYRFKNTGITTKPKITVDLIRPGDRLILSCDGLKDYVHEQEIIEHIVDMDQAAPHDLAQSLVSYAIDQKSSCDNVTVLVMQVQ